MFSADRMSKNLSLLILFDREDVFVYRIIYDAFI